MAVDLEGCQRYGTHYVGSFSAASRSRETVYDVFADHGGWRTDEQFITALPPKFKNLGVDWPDLNPANGATPIKEVLENAVQLMVCRTIIFHDAGADMRMLNRSAALCGIAIPWDQITIRDTQKFHGWQWFALGHPGPSLRDCVAQILKIPNFQANGHTGRDDAAHTMELYLREEAAIERQYADMTPGQQAAALASSSAGTDSESEEKFTTDTPGTSPSIDGLVEAMPKASINLDIGTAAVKTTDSGAPQAPTFAAAAQVQIGTAQTVKLTDSVGTGAAPSMSVALDKATVRLPHPDPATQTAQLFIKPALSWAQVAKTRSAPTTAQVAQQQTSTAFRRR
ncbi:hypothetical protein LTR36_004481 [Oleoguttula mirabilis]|uniref:Exonuclease domain-containing protein n=1 Tax=Oleoguttula mirabilis TaxID=1507867 RepID=A0AAV9JH55_9PEZI|nr:hypothetical protein LTR36_004481 [Oleoguttula mirabilis]